MFAITIMTVWVREKIVTALHRFLDNHGLHRLVCSAAMDAVRCKFSKMLLVFRLFHRSQVEFVGVPSKEKAPTEATVAEFKAAKRKRKPSGADQQSLPV
jgi:hypothetical protein